jgi:hypothetical protein
MGDEGQVVQIGLAGGHARFFLELSQCASTSRPLRRLTRTTILGVHGSAREHVGATSEFQGSRPAHEEDFGA